ncbi:alpha/beta fold hydrolase [Rhodoferax sp.]|uniref:alpha/beta hydrolase n=1 Tax=Rhodoferax sp. TaxID=50421 RepID=UPI002629013A|nr:alpha/beta fold hydrolase [Rhodoferax sp.]MDD2925199.1 alpha/beta fold hydrolase [Rhodoferax sp.]
MKLVTVKIFSVTGLFSRILTLALLLATSGCAWLDGQQRQIIYRPTPSTVGLPSDVRPGDQAFLLATPDAGASGQLALWWLPHPAPNAPTLLYLHGTFRNLLGNQHKIQALRDAGFAVLAVDYRGWGQSTAITPSEQTIMQDARVAWAELVRREPRAGRRVIYGHSMGSGVAVALASSLPSQGAYGGLILESAFTSFADVARAAGFWASVLSLFNHERFASIDHIGQITAPLLMLHGRRDDTVPIGLGERLFAAANAPKHWLVIENGQHSDLNLVAPEAYRQALQAFTARYVSPP